MLKSDPPPAAEPREDAGEQAAGSPHTQTHTHFSIISHLLYMLTPHSDGLLQFLFSRIKLVVQRKLYEIRQRKAANPQNLEAGTRDLKIIMN